MDASQNIYFGNSGTNVPVGGSTVSSSGDIILNNTPKSSKKKWIVISAVGVVLLIGILIFAVIMTRGGVSRKSGVGITNETVAFNRYANYYLYGNDSVDTVNIDIDANSAYFIVQGDLGELPGGYIDRLGLYYKEFWDLYESAQAENGEASSGEEESDQIDFGAYKTKLDLLTNYYGGGMLMSNEIIKAYLESGEEGARKLVDETFAPYSKLDDIYGLNYYDLAMEWGGDAVELAVLYRGIGCMADGKLDFECVANSDSEGMIELQNDMSVNMVDMQAIIYNAKRDLTWVTLSIAEQLYGMEGINEE